jgi:hypothetical protein
MANHGLASFLVHPDYIREERAQSVYEALLAHLSQSRDEGKLWLALPGEVSRWWRERSKMTLSRQGDRWEIDGPGKERARIACAKLEGDGVVYQVLQPESAQAAGKPHPARTASAAA